jgi:uncharacterized membrane protein YphA (DoxX/SURF4 family)
MFNLDGFRPDAMDALVGPIFHVSIIIGIFYAWTIGYRKESKFRPGKARNMKEEFIVYGLPFWLMYATGTIKIISSVLLILGFFYPIFLKPVAAVLCLVMGGAVLMHLKIREDKLIKAFPSYYLFCCCVFLLMD